MAWGGGIKKTAAFWRQELGKTFHQSPCSLLSPGPLRIFQSLSSSMEGPCHRDTRSWGEDRGPVSSVSHLGSGPRKRCWGKCSGVSQAGHNAHEKERRCVRGDSEDTPVLPALWLGFANLSGVPGSAGREASCACAGVNPRPRACRIGSRVKGTDTQARPPALWQGASCPPKRRPRFCGAAWVLVSSRRRWLCSGSGPAHGLETSVHRKAAQENGRSGCGHGDPRRRGCFLSGSEALSGVVLAKLTRVQEKLAPEPTGDPTPPG